VDLLIVLVLVLGVVAGAGIAIWHGWHSSEREQVLLAELEALRAVNRLSVAAWQARQALRQEVSREAGRS